MHSVIPASRKSPYEETNLTRGLRRMGCSLRSVPWQFVSRVVV